MKLLMFMGALLMFGCGNKVSVPSTVKTEVRGQVDVNVVHNIVISTDLLDIFKDMCEKSAEVLNVPAENREVYVQDCILDKEAALFQLINK